MLTIINLNIIIIMKKSFQLSKKTFKPYTFMSIVGYIKKLLEKT